MSKILFLCTGNACRSQMAEGWARHLSGDEHQFFSAGIEAHGLNPLAVEVMAEVGVDISGHTSDVLNTDLLNEVDLVVTVCGNADERCPVLSAGTKKLHWPLADPARLTGSEAAVLEGFRSSRDDIRLRVESLLRDDL